MATSTQFVEADLYDTGYLDARVTWSLRFFEVTDDGQGGITRTALAMDTAYDASSIKLLVYDTDAAATAQESFTGTVDTTNTDPATGNANKVDFVVFLDNANSDTTGEESRRWRVVGDVSAVTYAIGKPRKLNVYDGPVS